MIFCISVCHYGLIWTMVVQISLIFVILSCLYGCFAIFVILIDFGQLGFLCLIRFVPSRFELLRLLLFFFLFFLIVCNISSLLILVAAFSRQSFHSLFNPLETALSNLHVLFIKPFTSALFKAHHGFEVGLLDSHQTFGIKSSLGWLLIFMANWITRWAMLF